MARAPFKPTPDLRQKVRQLAVVGLPQDDIATLVGCSAKTLRKHFRKELDQGGAEAIALVAGYLLQAAKSGNVAAQIFFLKTRARWSTTTHAPQDQEAISAETQAGDAKIIENMMARMRQAERADGSGPGTASDVADSATEIQTDDETADDAGSSCAATKEDDHDEPA